MVEKLRDPVSGLTHLGAAIAAAFGLGLLLFVGWGDTGRVISLLIYGYCLLQMFSASATYHMIPAQGKTLRILRKLDHAAIYLLIAGTYTPVCYNVFSGFWQWGMLAIIWAFAVVGVVVKLFVINAPRWVTAGVYLMMGWLSIIALQEMIRLLPTGALFWLGLGGLFFSLGAVIYMTKWMDFFPGKFGFHETWHIFVILGCLCHYILMLAYIAPIR
jgi:hemolysin III